MKIGYAQTVITPALKGGFTPVCSNCHNNNAPGGLSLTAGDNAAICYSVLGKLDQTDITKSSIITHVSPGATHAGGMIPAANLPNWKQLFVDNKAVFF